MLRASSVPPGLCRSAVQVSSSARLPSYCPPHGQYFGFNPAATTPTPRAAVSSRNIQSHVIVPPRTAPKVVRSAYFDTVPRRNFGSKLSGMGYSSYMARPEIYEQAYGQSHLPGFGRDSYSSYKLAGATLDDDDDLVRFSNKKDQEVLRSVERHIANASYVPVMPVRRSSHTTRACSVPPLHSRHVPIKTSKFGKTAAIRKPGMASIVVKAQGSADGDLYYRVPQPSVIVKQETVTRGNELLSAKERMYGRESYDLSSPTATCGLKMRINELQNGLAKQGAMLNKYLSGPDADDIEIHAELRRIKTNRECRSASTA